MSIIAGINEGIIPLKISAIETYDPVIKKEAEVHERALLYVAATRAKKTYNKKAENPCYYWLGDKDLNLN